MAIDRSAEKGDSKAAEPEAKKLLAEESFSSTGIPKLDEDRLKADSFRFHGGSKDTLSMGQLDLPSIWKALGAEMPTQVRAAEQVKAAEKESDEAGSRQADKPQARFSFDAKTGKLELSLTEKEKIDIGKRIFQNETSGNAEKLVHINKGEDFLSFGINHMILPAQDTKSNFGNSVSPYIKKLEEQGIKLPDWLSSKSLSPWSSKDELESGKDYAKRVDLLHLAVKTVPQQIDHSIERMQESLPKILAAADPEQREKLEKRINDLLKTGERGVFAMVDYVNFKGEGLGVSAAYKNTGWGLKHVLENMQDTGDPLKDFSDAAFRVLQNRVENAPSQAQKNQEQQWLSGGWKKRVEDYQSSPESAKLPELPKAEALESLKLAYAQKAEQVKKPAPQVQKEVEQVKKPVPQVQKEVEQVKKPAPQVQKEVEQIKKPVPQVQKEVEQVKKPVPQVQKEVDSNKDLLLPQAVLDKSAPKKGQGYYQPLKSSMKELLGRELSEGEMRAGISAARSLREKQGKSSKELSVNDRLMPASMGEAKDFVDNLGNAKFGKQYLKSEELAAFKKELEGKFAQFSKEKPADPVKQVEPELKPVEPAKQEDLPPALKEEQKVPQEKQVPKKDPAEPVKPAVEEQKTEKKPPQEQETERKAPEKLEMPAAKAEPHECGAGCKHAEPQEKESKPLSPEQELAKHADTIKLIEGSKPDGVLVAERKEALVRSELKLPSGLSKDLPVAVVPGMPPGRLGLLSITDSNGEKRHVPFVSGLMANGKGTKQDIVINNAAADALGLKQAKPGEKPGSGGQIDAISLMNEKVLPKNAEQLKQRVFDALKAVAEKSENVEKATDARKDKHFNEVAYIPKPDDDFGYRRSERNDNELEALQKKLRQESENYFQLSESLKPGSSDAANIIKMTLSEALKEKSELQGDLKQFDQIFDKLRAGVSSSKFSDKLLEGLPPDLARDLRLARYNRHAYEKNMEAVNDPFQFMHKETNLKNANQALEYYKNQEERAKDRAELYLQITKDKIVLQDRILADANHPTEAQALLRHRFAMKAAAAHAVSTNPDLLPGNGDLGALHGKRIVLNAGHDVHHGSSTPGFPAYDWSKTEANPQGMSEYDINKVSTAILAEMIQFAGGTPIHVNQDELYKKGDQSAQKMPGLAKALLAPDADAIISNHADDYKDIKAGTLTLVNKNSHKFGALVNSAKGDISGVPAKALRQQLRGVQHHVGTSNVILNELLTTAAHDREKILNPHEIARLQLGVLIGTERFLNPPAPSRIKSEKAKDEKSAGWQSFWSKESSKSRFKLESLPYPKAF